MAKSPERFSSIPMGLSYGDFVRALTDQIMPMPGSKRFTRETRGQSYSDYVRELTDRLFPMPRQSGELTTR